MDNLQQEAILFVERLQSLYFEQRNFEALLPEMTEETSWIGTGEGELCKSLEDAKAAFSLEVQEGSGKFTIVKTEYDAVCASENVCVVFGEVTARPESLELADLCNRVTAVCVRTATGMTLLHLHMSAPDADQENGRFFITRDESGRRETLRLRAEKIATELRERNHELEALTENIPGGVHQCKDNDKMTFLSMSHSFLTLVGYSQAEIRYKFHGNFSEMIYQDDLKSVYAEMEEQLSRGDRLELEYRIMRGDGKLLWIMEQGKLATLADGSKCFYCVLLDITRQKEQREELRLTLERHQIIMDQTTDIIFEWDILNDSLTFSSNWHKKFGYEAIRESISQEILKSQNVHHEDMLAFTKIMNDSAEGVAYSEAELRIRDVFGNFKWHRIRATAQYDSKRRPIKAIGVIVDIDLEKQQTEHLLYQAQRDSLTNLYNKATINELVSSHIARSFGTNCQVLLIIDVDDFKAVNDTFGHLCGDTLLCDVASVLKNHFTVRNFVGRIGGDEFLVYLPDIASESDAYKKVEGLLLALGKIRPIVDAPPISCSIGAALFPQKDADYFTVYKCADAALYHIKAQGKSNFAFYDPKTCTAPSANDLADTAVGGIDSDAEIKNDAVGDSLAQYTFRMLYNSIDINTAVEHLMEIVGRAYDVSRVYIFESSDDGKRCSNTFEWCNADVSSEMDNLQDIDYEKDLGGYLQNFNQNHIFYCQDICELHPLLYGILAPQGIRSVLQCAIMDDGEFKCYVGFDECRENRLWTDSQVVSLTYISNVLSTFLLKLRLKEKLARGQNSEAGAASDKPVDGLAKA